MELSEELMMQGWTVSEKQAYRQFLAISQPKDLSTIYKDLDRVRKEIDAHIKALEARNAPMKDINEFYGHLDALNSLQIKVTALRAGVSWSS